MTATGTAGRWLAIAATAVAVAAVIAAIVVMGGPSALRQAKLDERRVADLVRIAGDAREYFESHGRLPPDLATLGNQPGRRLPIDPDRNTPYDYETIDANRFRLCAEFATDTAQTPEGGEKWGGEDWSHAAGRQCFERKAKRP